VKLMYGQRDVAGHLPATWWSTLPRGREVGVERVVTVVLVADVDERKVPR